ncbi:MAG: AmpG family muropeptide MFS transporter [Alphaproteobacteria bacterium]
MIRLSAWAESAAIYGERRVLAVLFLGFASGLPLLLTASTLAIRLTESGVDLATIGLFAMVGVPYSLKFLWSPLIDRLPLPVLSRVFGRRRGWLLLTQAALIAALVALGAVDPRADPGLTALLALVVAFCSASQDIVIDAYRVELLDERQQGAGAAMVVFGYRMAMLVAGAGALYLATFYDWFWTYAAMAALVLVGTATVLVTPEPARRVDAATLERERRIAGAFGAAGAAGAAGATGRAADLAAWLSSAVVAPFADFLGRRGWAVILAFVVLYKFGDALAGVMANPFYVDIGFSKVEIANVSKLYGFVATLAGGFVGGIMVHRLGIAPSLLICGVLQMASNAVFAVQALVGPDIAMLMVTIGFENLSGGMGTAAFVAYLSSLCNVAYTATQYALLSSLMSVARTVLASPGGMVAEATGWVTYFLITTLAAVPGLLLAWWLVRRPTP